MPTARTPGSVPTRAVAWRKKLTICWSSLYLAPGRRTTIVSKFSGLNPVSIFCSRTKLLTSSPALTSSTSASATSATTSTSRNRRLRAPCPPAPLPPSLSVSLRFRRVASSAGARPKMIPVTSETLSVQASTGRLMPTP